MRPPCKDCPHLKVTKDISGTEAHCLAKSKRGRMILWQYGIDIKKTWYQVWGELTMRQAPCWCPRTKEENL